MQRIKLIKDSGKYKKGQVVYIDNNEAFALIDSGLALKTKDLIEVDYKTSSNRLKVVNRSK